MGVDFDDIILEVEDDFEEVPSGKVGQALPMTVPGGTSVGFSAPPFDARGTLELVKNADKLFDFTGSNLDPVQQMYIIAFAAKGNKAGACRVAGVTYGVVKEWLKDDEFKEALENAVEIAQDSLEEEMLRRAMNGSDKLLVTALKAMKPEKYQPKQSTDVNINGQVVHTWADLAKQAQLGSGEVIDAEEFEE